MLHVRHKEINKLVGAAVVLCDPDDLGYSFTAPKKRETEAYSSTSSTTSSAPSSSSPLGCLRRSSVLIPTAMISPCLTRHVDRLK